MNHKNECDFFSKLKTDEQIHEFLDLWLNKFVDSEENLERAKATALKEGSFMYLCILDMNQIFRLMRPNLKMMKIPVADMPARMAGMPKSPLRDEYKEIYEKMLKHKKRVVVVQLLIGHEKGMIVVRKGITVE